MNSLLTVNSVMHALWLHPMYCMHYVWQAPLALFLLYRELFSDHELFTDRELHEAHTYNSFTHIYLIDLLYKIVSHTFLRGVGGTEIH